MRFRLEMNSPGDFKTSTTLIPFVKDAYLTAKVGRHTLMLGLIGTPLRMFFTTHPKAATNLRRISIRIFPCIFKF
jgi:hypothetical protein